MFGRTAAEAVSAHVATVQQAVHCLTSDVVRAGSYRSDEPSPTLVLARGEIVSLTGGPLSLGFRLRQFYRVVEDQDAPARRRWRVLITGYFYTFLLRGSEQELLAFHWHSHTDKAFPHVHLESGLGLQRDLVGIHVPTGEIALQDVIRFAIEDLGVRPRLARWRSVLDRTRARYADPDE